MSISSIIVTYQPDISVISESLFSNMYFLNQIVVVDNGSSNLEDLKKIIKTVENVKLVELDDNLGIATAQNIGMRSLDVPDDELIVFFDQDSSIDIDFLSLLETEYLTIESKYKKPTILGPAFYHRQKKFEYPIVKFNRHGFRKKIYTSRYEEEIEASCIISSGMCVRKSTLNYVGYMKDELFIDYVDTEWCLRARNKGVKILVSPKLVMEHEIGNDNIKIFRWRVPVHSATRRYYRIRNSITLFKYSHVPFIVCLHESLFSIFHQCFLIFLTDNKLGHLKSLYKGVRDGLTSLCKTNG